jgi:hypothetical protein
MSRRPLGTVLAELAAVMRPDSATGSALRVTRLSIDVPVEVALGLAGSDLVFLADLPRWRWRSDFDREPGRLALSLEAVVP